jgi:hypothetical protein
LDKQIAERKSRDQKQKTDDKLMQDKITNYDAFSSSHSDRLVVEKRDMQHNIQDYNEAAAHQKRATEKMNREMDKKDAANNFEKASAQDLEKAEGQRQRLEGQKDEMAKKERALSRDIQHHISSQQ